MVARGDLLARPQGSGRRPGRVGSLTLAGLKAELGREASARGARVTPFRVGVGSTVDATHHSTERSSSARHIST